MSLLIVVEGNSDKDFLEQYMCHMHYDGAYEIISNGGNSLTVQGKDGNHTLQSRIRRTISNEGRVCIVFDADANHKKAKNNIVSGLKECGFDSSKIEVFLFPDNESGGNLETLLSNIVRVEFKGVLECFDKYVKCIDNKFPNLTKNIDKKSKMFAYREAVGLEKRIKENYKNLKNFDLFSDYFDLDSKYLEPLRKFLFV